MIKILEYNPEWKMSFEKLYADLWPVTKSFVSAIEHVGSTSVEGVAAKPIIDLDLVIDSYKKFPELSKELVSLGYEYSGDLGIKHRHAFIHKTHEIKHHLYVCLQESLALKNHLAIREHLRCSSKDAAKYSKLKIKLASSGLNSDEYCKEKTDFLISILDKVLTKFDLEQIKKDNLTQIERTETPIIETERLILKPPTSHDIPSCQKHFNNYNIIKHLVVTVPWPYPENGVQEYFENIVFPKQGHNCWYWGIFLKNSPDECIGLIDLWRKGAPENRGFWLAEDYWGKGYITEAVISVMNQAFDSLGFDYLVFANGLGNEKSRRVKEKTGARLLSVQKTEVACHEYDDSEIWFLTKNAWEDHIEK